MSETSEPRVRAILLGYFSMFIAALSLFTSIYNGYLHSKFVNFIQRNAGRTEYLRICKEIIDGYFQVKMRIGMINPLATGADQPDPPRLKPQMRWRSSAHSEPIWPISATKPPASATLG
ncbi:MAG: hypothetical protein EXQ82_11035 [Pseudolabrys sp.]|nr:hypothetical protein [Pseudolabrys sp.]